MHHEIVHLLTSQSSDGFKNNLSSEEAELKVKRFDHSAILEANTQKESQLEEELGALSEAFAEKHARANNVTVRAEYLK